MQKYTKIQLWYYGFSSLFDVGRWTFDVRRSSFFKVSFLIRLADFWPEASLIGNFIAFVESTMPAFMPVISNIEQEISNVELWDRCALLFFKQSTGIRVSFLRNSAVLLFTFTPRIQKSNKTEFLLWLNRPADTGAWPESFEPCRKGWQSPCGSDS